jgi:hypothetical protein
MNDLEICSHSKYKSSRGIWIFMVSLFIKYDQIHSIESEVHDALVWVLSTN